MPRARAKRSSERRRTPARRSAATRTAAALVTGFGRVSFPTWSPRGHEIVFTGERGGDYELHAIDVRSRRIRRLTDPPGNDAHAAWSADGEWLAFVSTRGGFKDSAALHPRNPQGSGDLFVMRADGSAGKMTFGAEVLIAHGGEPPDELP